MVFVYMMMMMMLTVFVVVVVVVVLVVRYGRTVRVDVVYWGGSRPAPGGRPSGQHGR